MLNLTLSSGLSLLKQKAYKQLHGECIAAIRQNVNAPLPYFFLGIIASDHDNHLKALDLFSKASELDDTIIEFHIYHAKTLSTLGRRHAAKVTTDKAAKYETHDPLLLDTMGVIYSRSGYHELAIPFFKRAVALRPEEANFHFNLAASAQFIGDFDIAKTAYEETLRLNPKFYRAWSSLTSLNKQTADNNHLQTLISLFDDVERDAEGELQLGHAIAKTLEDLGKHEESLTWLSRGKEKKRDQLRYDRKAGKAVFSSAKLTVRTGSEPKNHHVEEAPIFIFGLPRTGTTLVDRILSSHTHVTSAGELNIFAELVKEDVKSASNYVLDAETFLRAREIDLSSVGKAYIEATQDKAGNSKHMIDKMPLNFFYAGLLHRALPNARMIALRRCAMDSCLSNYRQLFSTQYSYYNYTFDLEDTAWFYRQFDDLMKHWRAALPETNFMEVAYEDIVFDQENQTRRLLEFCGLPWEDACMRFHENEAAVSTASSVQVRQPLYSGSIGRWKKYGDKLDGLRDALGDLAD
ncbi:MAG: sulfotransferase [Hellea sp.]